MSTRSAGQDRPDRARHPGRRFVDPTYFKDQFGVEGRVVLLTFGLLSPNKGIEHVLDALPEILEEFPDVVYIVLGATHPNVLREHGEAYRLSLERLAKKRRIEKNVIFYNRFVDLEESERVHRRGGPLHHSVPQRSADHLRHAGLRVRSGQSRRLHALLACRGAAGRRSRRSGSVRRLRGHGARSNRRCCATTRAGTRCARMRTGSGAKWSGATSRSTTWIIRAVAPRGGPPRLESRWPRRRSTERPRELPGVEAGPSVRMTDSTGMFQHATFSIPNFAEGYCTDDNARALMLTVLLGELGEEPDRVRAPRDHLRRLPSRTRSTANASGSTTS